MSTRSGRRLPQAMQKSSADAASTPTPVGRRSGHRMATKFDLKVCGERPKRVFPGEISALRESAGPPGTQDRVDDAQRACRLEHIVSPDPVGSACDREGGSREAPGEAFARFLAPAQSLEERLPRHAHHNRPSQGSEDIEMPQQVEVVVQILSETDAGVHRDRFRRDPSFYRLSHTIRQETANLVDDVNVDRAVLHRLWLASEVHEDDADT